jgi:hypothetical protein
MSNADRLSSFERVGWVELFAKPIIFAKGN